MSMKKSTKISLLVGEIAVVLIGVIGITYAFFSTGGKQETANTFTSGCLNISLTDASSSINLNNIYPITDIEGLDTTSYDFTITNTCTSENASNPINYVVTLNTLTSNVSNLPLSVLRYKLNETSPSAVAGTSGLLGSATPYDFGDSIKTTYDLDASYNLVTGTLAPGESITYNLYLWIDENANTDIMNQTFTGRVLVYSYM